MVIMVTINDDGMRFGIMWAMLNIREPQEYCFVYRDQVLGIYSIYTCGLGSFP